MTGCARCGRCCEAIALSLTKKAIRADTQHNPEDKRFILAHWRRISRAEATRRFPGIVMGNSNRVMYECDQYDAVTHSCLAQDEKPPVCRNFPFYHETDPARQARMLSPFKRCSFWHALPRALWAEKVDPLPDPEATRGT